MKRITTRLLSLVLLGAFIPSFVLADNWYLENGDITVNATETSQTVTQGGGTPTVDDNPVITSSGKTENTVTIKAEENATANVTLENVNIDVSSNQEAAITTQGQGDVTLNLSGNNSATSGDYHAGVDKENVGNLTITTPEGGTGSLNATGGKGGAEGEAVQLFFNVDFKAHFRPPAFCFFSSRFTASSTTAEMAISTSTHRMAPSSSLVRHSW